MQQWHVDYKSALDWQKGRFNHTKRERVTITTLLIELKIAILQIELAVGNSAALIIEHISDQHAR